MSRLILYTRPECHLCDIAEEMLSQLGLDPRMDFVDIEQDIALVSRYGSRIPVLRNAGSGQELNWPFESADVMALAGDPRDA